MHVAKICFLSRRRPVFVVPLLMLFVAPVIAQTNTNGVLNTMDGYVVVPHATQLNLAPRLTIEAWLKPAPNQSSFAAVVDKGYLTGFALAVASISGRSDSVEVVLQVRGSHVQGPRIASDNITWTHLAVSIDTLAHQVVFYVNGVEVRSTSGPAARFEDNIVDLRIGRSNYGDQFLGQCDEIRIWNVIRSAGQIAALWNHEARGNEPGLVALYHFEDERDTVAWNRSLSGGLHGAFSQRGLIITATRPETFIDENEPNGSFAAATPVDYGSAVLTAAIAPADTDFYKIWMRAGDAVLVQTSAKTAADSGNIIVNVYGPDSVTRIVTYDLPFPSFNTAASVAGYRYVRITNKSGPGCSYILATTLRAALEVDATEPNNTQAQATPRAWGERIIATILPGLDAWVAVPDTDYYAFPTEPNDIGFFLYSYQGVNCGSGEFSLLGPSGLLSKTYPNVNPNFRSPAGGTYYARVRPVEAAYQYVINPFKGLADIHDMLFDPGTWSGAVRLVDGMAGAYDGAYVLKINGASVNTYPDYSRTEVGGRQFVFKPATLSGLSVVRKFFVPTAAQGDTLGFMRVQDILTNPTAAPITVNVGVYSDLGANPCLVKATSSGDTVLTLQDTWLWTDDKYISSVKPDLVHIFDGAGGADRVDSVSIAGDRLYWEWRDVTVGPGETKIYLYFVTQDSFAANAQRKGPAFSGSVLPAAAKLGLGGDARLVRNWPTEALVSTEMEEPTPTAYTLEQNYPNPFNPSTTIGYTIAGTGHEAIGNRWVRLVVYDMLGREVAVLVNEKKAPGNYEVKFDGSTLSSGVYFYRLQVRPLDFAVGRDSRSGAGDFVQSKKFILLK